MGVLNRARWTKPHAVMRRVAVDCPDTTTSTVTTSRRTRSISTPATQPDNSESVSPHEFKAIYNGVYQRFYRLKKISAEDESQIAAYEVDIDEFVRLTEHKQYAGYISLIDGRVIFHEVPNAPHGQVIDYLVISITSQLNLTMFAGAVDNGRSSRSPRFCVAYTLDMPLTNRSLKRPDYSWQLRKQKIPTPPPSWMKFLPDGFPYPNIVVEVEVNNESPAQLINYANMYFSADTSVRLWIAVKVWLVGKKFWVGWGERASTGTGVTLHTAMAWPPEHLSIATPVDIIYNIPMTVIYGPGIPIPPNTPPTLEISVEEIRQRIVEFIR